MPLELDIQLPDKNSGQLVSQLHRQLRTAIVSGRLRAGTQLPPTRKLALQLGISRNTVVAAYDLLLSEGRLGAFEDFVDHEPGIMSPGTLAFFFSNDIHSRIQAVDRNMVFMAK